MIYLDHASTTPILPVALGAFCDAQYQSWGNPNSAHEFGEHAREKLEQARKTIAGCIHARPDEIHFTASASDACQWAMETLSQNCAVTQVGATEHSAVLHFPVRTNKGMKRRGYALMLANNETGERYPAVKPENKTDLVFRDATAAMGHIPIDVRELGADMIAAGGHKFGAPCGVGFLYAKRGTPLAGRRDGTPPVAMISAMAAALKWHCEHMDENTRQIEKARYRFLGSVVKIPDIWVNGREFADEFQMPHILNVSFDGVDGKALALLCSRRGVMVSAGAACTSGKNEPSHVILAMYGDENRARSAIRVSFGHENAPHEAEQAAQIIAECVAHLRSIG